jgi:hypothetical protein
LASTRQAFRDHVEAQLPDDIINMMYMLRLIPEEEDAFLQVVELARKRIEDIKRHSKARNFAEVTLPKHTTETEKQKVINQNKDTRKEKKMEETVKNNKKEEKDKKPKKKKYASTKEALNGISEELIQKYEYASASF